MWLSAKHRGLSTSLFIWPRGLQLLTEAFSQPQVTRVRGRGMVKWVGCNASSTGECMASFCDAKVGMRAIRGLCIRSACT